MMPLIKIKISIPRTIICIHWGTMYWGRSEKSFSHHSLGEKVDNVSLSSDVMLWKDLFSDVFDEDSKSRVVRMDKDVVFTNSALGRDLFLNDTFWKS